MRGRSRATRNGEGHPFRSSLSSTKAFSSCPLQSFLNIRKVTAAGLTLMRKKVWCEWGLILRNGVVERRAGGG